RRESRSMWATARAVSHVRTRSSAASSGPFPPPRPRRAAAFPPPLPGGAAPSTRGPMAGWNRPCPHVFGRQAVDFHLIRNRWKRCGNEPRFRRRMLDLLVLVVVVLVVGLVARSHVKVAAPHWPRPPCE